MSVDMAYLGAALAHAGTKLPGSVFRLRDPDGIAIASACERDGLSSAQCAERLIETGAVVVPNDGEDDAS